LKDSWAAYPDPITKKKKKKKKLEDNSHVFCFVVVLLLKLASEVFGGTLGYSIYYIIRSLLEFKMQKYYLSQ
jgi:hypothetical protein